MTSATGKWMASVTLCIVLGGNLPVRAANGERVFFDVPRTMPCTDVTTPEFLAANPSERMIEARIQISSLIRNGGDDDLLQFFYRFDCRTPGTEVVTYFPQTTLDTPIAGTVGVNRTTEKSHTLGLSVTGAMDHVITGTGSGNVSSKNTTNLQYDLLPPLEMIAASGTLNRRTGVYFKLKPNSQTSLEGGKEFLIVLRVPSYWRGDVLQVQCQATGYHKIPAPPFEERGTIGSQRFLVALYLEGDEDAKHVAQQFATSEQELRNLALAHRSEIEKQAYPTTALRVGKFLPVVEPRPRIPANWLEQIVYSPASAELGEYARRLPADVQAAARDYVAARRELAKLANSN